MGSVFKPLLDIPLHQTVIDELHLFLRIFDVLLRNLIYMTLKIDQEHSSNTHTAALKKAIAECGVSFSLYKKKDGRNTTYDWTILWGEIKSGYSRFNPKLLILFGEIAIWIHLNNRCSRVKWQPACPQEKQHK